MGKQQKNFRLSQLTIDQLAEISERWNMSEADVVTLAIDRVYNQDEDNRLDEVKSQIANVTKQTEEMFNRLAEATGLGAVNERIAPTRQKISEQMNEYSKRGEEIVQKLADATGFSAVTDRVTGRNTLFDRLAELEKTNQTLEERIAELEDTKSDPNSDNS